MSDIVTYNLTQVYSDTLKLTARNYLFITKFSYEKSGVLYWTYLVKSGIYACTDVRKQKLRTIKRWEFHTNLFSSSISTTEFTNRFFFYSSFRCLCLPVQNPIFAIGLWFIHCFSFHGIFWFSSKSLRKHSSCCSFHAWYDISCIVSLFLKHHRTPEFVFVRLYHFPLHVFHFIGKSHPMSQAVCQTDLIITLTVAVRLHCTSIVTKYSNCHYMFCFIQLSTLIALHFLRSLCMAASLLWKCVRYIK